MMINIAAEYAPELCSIKPHYLYGHYVTVFNHWDCRNDQIETAKVTTSFETQKYDPWISIALLHFLQTQGPRKTYT